jgi:hypothetical protein
MGGNPPAFRFAKNFSVSNHRPLPHISGDERTTALQQPPYQSFPSKDIPKPALQVVE